MFGLLSNLAKAAVGVVVDTPISLIADAVTMGGALTDREEPYTAIAISRVVENIERAVDPE